MMNHLFRLPYQFTPGMLEKVEREESAELVEFITEAIKNHIRCKHCKSQKATRVKASDCPFTGEKGLEKESSKR
jgi:Zn finger protein HypA/HybF involved in hydrogenase expression